MSLTRQKAGNLTYKNDGTGAVVRTLKDKLGETVSVKDFGAVGDGVTDDTAALLAARAYVAVNAPVTLHIPKGTYNYTDIGNWAITGLTIQGEGPATVLNCVSAASGNTAFYVNPFADGNPTDPFLQDFHLCDLVIQGNANTIYGIRVIGMARSSWSNVWVSGANSSTGIAIQLDGGSSCVFTNVGCSTDRFPLMSPIPYIGLNLVEGFRAGVSIGSVTNNTFVNCMFEGVTKGVVAVSADQCLFLGGTSESCTSIGIDLKGSARFCTFINHAMEANTNYDVLCDGIYNQFLNCYSLGKVLVTSNYNLITGGFYERIEIQTGVKNVVENVRLNHVGGGAGGFFDTGDATEWKNLFDAQLNALIYPLKARVGVTMPVGPQTEHEFINPTRQYIEVILQDSTYSEIKRVRDGTPFLAQKVTPCSIWLAPNESLLFSYGSGITPSVSYLPHNGFQG